MSRRGVLSDGRLNYFYFIVWLRSTFADSFVVDLLIRDEDGTAWDTWMIPFVALVPSIIKEETALQLFILIHLNPLILSMQGNITVLEYEGGSDRKGY